MIAGLVGSLAARREDMRAHYALILELDDEHHLLRSRLTSRSTVHAVTARLTATLLALTDALVFHRTV